MMVRVIKSLLSILLIFSSFNIIYAEESNPINNELYGSSQTAEHNSAYGFFLSIANDETRSEVERNNAKYAAEYLANWSNPDYWAENCTKDEFKKGITHIGQEGDATTLENMLIALDMIDESNRLRTTDNNRPNLSALRVNLILMASTQVSTNAEKYYVGHFNLREGSSANAQWGVNGTNEAGIKRMYEGYYTSEKAYVDFINEYEKTKPEPEYNSDTDGDWQTWYDNTYTPWYNELVKAARKANAYPSSSSGSTGHYWNIVRESSTITGAAYNSFVA